MSDFLNLHVIFTAAAANMNRDDSGAPKTITYGGATRTRISSQAMTRPKRLAVEREFGSQLSFRSKDFAGVVIAHAERLFGGDLPPEIHEVVRSEAEKAVRALYKKSGTSGDEPSNNRSSGGEKATAVHLSDFEIGALAHEALGCALARRGGDTTAEIGAFISPKRSTALSVAAFGRMLANRQEWQNEAAVQRSHAYTTHATDIEPDYFTAVDDLTDSQGAAHLDYSLLSSGTFYWHANIDRHQLWANWIPPEDESETRAVLRSFVIALATALPHGKQTTMSSHGLPVALLAVETSQPDALHAAFEKPIIPERGGGYAAPSVERLVEAQAKLASFAPGWFKSGLLVTSGLVETNETQSLPECFTVGKTLDDFVDYVVEWLLAGRPQGDVS